MWMWLTFAAFADEPPQEPEAQAVVSSDDADGGYGGPIVGMALLDGQLAPAFGGRGGWVINHSVVIGGFGYWTELGDDPNGPLGVTCGGLFVEGIIGWRAPVHATVEAGLGIGATSHADAELRGVVFMPHVAARAELNVTDWLRIDVGPSYRFATRGDGVSGPISGPGAELLFKFGSF